MNAIGTAALALLLLAPGFVAHADGPAGFVGAQGCAGCHPAQAAAWKSSHHAQATQPATAATVLGNFNDSSFTLGDVTTLFHREAGRFMVRTEGANGAVQDHPVAFTLGVYPLPQYLIPLPGGRLQALGIAWDSRPRAQGGQRWFHLSPDHPPRPGDPLHWTGRLQTWNHQCAACHATDLRKNFDLAANSYATTFAEMNVACEACHGPGARHLAWARQPPGAARGPDAQKGLANPLHPTDGGVWEMDPTSGIARRTAKRAPTELDTCAPCHARRHLLVEAAPPGTPFLDVALPTLLRPGVYFPDGQIEGEVFEYGSFVQSAMHAAGVTCSDCHEPHGLGLRAQGNAVCAQCHLATRFDAATHHHHDPAGPGGQCVACHMPGRTYMVVHLRHDHGLRVPRPDLASALGTPDACTQCHAGRDPAWAARAISGWYPQGRQTKPQFGTAVFAGRTDAPDAAPRLEALLGQPDAPAIVRATALELLRAQPGGVPPRGLARAATDPDPLLRATAAQAAPAPLPRAALAVLAPLLDDPMRAVRVEAARGLAAVAPYLPDTSRGALARALRDLDQAEAVDADLPESHLARSLVLLGSGQPDAAEQACRTALQLDPRFVPALVNLADLARLRGRDQDAVARLHEAVLIEPENADAWHALGLALVRRQARPDALAALRRAHDLAANNARYAYVYAVALHAAGDRAAAIAVLEQAQQAHPSDRDLLIGLVTIARDGGDLATARRYARLLRALAPGDAQARALSEALERAP
ncbi:Tetratricopeptide repeat protein [Rhodovastum atsumiense]|nr:tetratricopeptide repeat protein [Rhodovastum atsumiense]CAH2602785.1 Tetratricopeptide repeat protein [Rhodovastum atsumiense]